MIGSPFAWMEDAECKGMDPELFFPVRGDTAGRNAALAACAECMVRERCLEHAMAHNEKVGIWGGTTERQRRLIRIAQRKEHAA
jgi:WhiB family redox-sensing transcriptional regulator